MGAIAGGVEVPQEITAFGDIGVVVTFGRCRDGSGGRKAGEKVRGSEEDARGGVGSAPKDSLSELTVAIEFGDIKISEDVAVNGVDDRDGFSERGCGSDRRSCGACSVEELVMASIASLPTPPAASKMPPRSLSVRLQRSVRDSPHVPHLKKYLSIAAVNSISNFLPTRNLPWRVDTRCP